jgi:hydroxyacylglutathione hydrolase
MSAEIHLFRCLQDNYGVLVHDPGTGATAAIDAPEASPVESALKATGWTLSDILVTHHHGDHTGGIAALKQRHGCRVTAPRKEAHSIPGVDATVGDGDTVTVGKLSARVIETPGHTLGQVNYFFPADKLLFAGDTLFSIGCGRTFEGTAQQMWASLSKLRALPDDTWIYCGHEYTESNCRFALTVEPENRDLVEFAEAVKHARAQGDKTIPSNLGIEKFCNPFLRCDQPRLLEKCGGPKKDPATAFGAIRAAKDTF